MNARAAPPTDSTGLRAASAPEVAGRGLVPRGPLTPWWPSVRSPTSFGETHG